MGFFTFGTGAGEAKDIMNSQEGMQKESWGMTKDYLSQIREAMSGYLTGKVGFDPLQLALMRSQFLNKAAGSYQNAGQQVKAALARTGSAGAGPVGGDYVRGIAGLEGGQADLTSGGLADIDLQNLQQMLKNKFTATGILQGNAAQLGDWGKTFGSGMSNALNQYTNAVQSGFGGQFMSAIGKSVGGGLGSMATGGLSNALGKIGINTTKPQQ